MIFFDDKKKMSTIMARRREKAGDHAEAIQMKPETVIDPQQGSEDGRHVAMMDFMAGHKEGSAHKMMKAMGNFMDLHMASDKGTGEPEIKE